MTRAVDASCATGCSSRRRPARAAHASRQRRVAAARGALRLPARGHRAQVDLAARRPRGRDRVVAASRGPAMTVHSLRTRALLVIADPARARRRPARRSALAGAASGRRCSRSSRRVRDRLPDLQRPARAVRGRATRTRSNCPPTPSSRRLAPGARRDAPEHRRASRARRRSRVVCTADAGRAPGRRLRRARVASLISLPRIDPALYVDPRSQSSTAADHDGSRRRSGTTLRPCRTGR